MSGQAMLIGIDGLDLDLLEGWFDERDLPNIYRLVKGGSRAMLKSVTPLNSAAAWTSMLTGKNPAGHGIYGFTRTHPDGYRRSAVQSGDIGAATLWEIANQGNAPVGLVNWPLTYPPPELDGFVISGIPIPCNQLWAYPPEVERALRDRFGQYIVDLPWWDLADGAPGRYESFIAGMYQMARKREDATLWAMRNRPWRILAVIFTGTDRLLHSFWRFSDPKHPSYNNQGAVAYGRVIKRYFILLDEIIGRILHSAGEDVPVILASDHGFGPLQYRFYIRKWLINRGYLKLKPGGRSNPDDEALDEPIRGVDWENTVAYPASMSESGVWINKTGRQARGIVDEDDYRKLCARIASELAENRPDGHKTVKSVYRREEILSGPYLAEAPDLLIEPCDNYILDDGPSDEEIAWSERETATHRVMGIFAASGPGFKEGIKLDNLNIVDVLPTLLATTGLPIPEDIEGKTALEAFVSPPVVKKSAAISPRRRRELSAADEEEKAMKEQLKGLGYL